MSFNHLCCSCGQIKKVTLYVDLGLALKGKMFDEDLILTQVFNFKLVSPKATQVGIFFSMKI